MSRDLRVLSALLVMASLSGCGAAPVPEPIGGTPPATAAEGAGDEWVADAPEAQDEAEDATATATERANAVARRAPAEATEVAPSGPITIPDVVPPSGTERLRVSATGPARGAAEPTVTLVVFSDFQCPFCSRLEPTLKQLLADYPDDLRMVFRHNPLPFHQEARPAAIAAIEANAQRGTEGFFAMHDLLFENQRALSRGDLERYAQQLQLDMAAFRQALDQESHAAIIEADQAATVRLRARGTPTSFVNGRKLTGAQPIDVFREAIHQEIALARREQSQGLSRSDIYARRMDGALEEAVAPPAAPPRPVPATVYHVPVGDSPVQGRSDALVTVIMFSDFQCPFCARVQPTLATLREDYGRDIRFVFKHNPLPFHADAGLAAEAAQEAFAQRGSRGFFRMHDVLFENQRALSRADLETYAGEARVNLRRLRRALDSRTHSEVIERDQALAARIGARGTPSFFINGRNLTGAQPVERFKALIDEELAKARERVASGTSRRRLYERIIENGVQDVPRAGSAASGRATATTIAEVPIPAGAPSRGDADAALTIQVFSDFQCPFCSRAVPTIDALLDAYPGRVRVVWRNLPLTFHRYAQLAAEAALEVQTQAGDEAFWQFHNALFENQRALTRADLERYATGVPGVDMNAFRSALDQRTHRERVAADASAAETVGIRGTPSFVLSRGDDHRNIRGAQSVESFRAVIDEMLRAP